MACQWTQPQTTGFLANHPNRYANTLVGVDTVFKILIIFDNYKSLILLPTELLCPYGWCPSGYVCYRAFDELVSWHTANTRCRREGGRLATVKDTDTHNFIVPLKNSVDPDEEFWIGLSDLGDIELSTLDNDPQLICN